MRNKIVKNLSIIVTAHNEGLIAHKTMLSIFRSIKACAGIETEIIVTLDRPDKETMDYFERYNTNPLVTVHIVDFGGLSESRNYAAKIARGTYITFLDADDLVSENWLIRAYEILQKNTDIIVHPEYSVTFGDDNLIWKKRDSCDTDIDTLCFVDNNLWDSPSMSLRDTYLAYPYVPNGNGFGYEDKQFHATTLSAGLSHRVAPNTILFVRRKISGSMLRQASADLATLAPTPLLGYDNIRTISPPKPEKQIHAEKTEIITALRHQTKLLAKKAHNIGKRYKAYNQLIQPVRSRYHKQYEETVYAKFPAWLIEEWRAIHKIDNTIFPAKALLDSMPFYNAENLTPGIKYAHLIQQFSQQPDTLFFVPWLIKGGADMLFINYPTLLKNLHPDWHIAMLQTEQKESVWKDKLPDSIDFINLYDTFNEIDFDTQFRLLAILITQNNIRRIIIGNSQLAYDFVSRHQTLIRRLDIAVYCYAFGEEFDDEGRLWGHIHTGIPRIYPVIHRIITDNENTVNKLVAEYAFDPNRFDVHYQPTKVEIKSPVRHTNTPLKILWASRICKQKRPDILKSVAERLDNKEFKIDAYGQLEEDFTEQFFDGTNISYKGSFNGMSSIPTGNYDIYLYTSEGDGVPNVLQEITASGLPIVASNVGGIREFVKTSKTGMLVENHNNIDDYVDAIRHLSDPKLRALLAKGAQDLLRTQFSTKTWEQSVNRAFDK